MSLKEQYCLAKYLDIDNDCLIKPDFLKRELNKVFTILEEGQVRVLNLLQKNDQKYQKHFEVLKRGMSLDQEEPELSTRLLGIFRERAIPESKWLDSLGSFLLEEYSQLEIDQHNQRVFVTPELFELFLRNKWNHKIPENEIKEILRSVESGQSRSMKNLDDGLFFGGLKEKVNIVELANQIETRLRFKQKSLLAHFRICMFAIFRQSEGRSIREYFASNGISHLNKRIELFQFHFHNSTHLKFKLEDSDHEFLKLDTEQRNKVKYSDFVRRIERVQSQIPNSENLLRDSRILREKDESEMRNSQSQASESRRKITRKSNLC